MQSKDCIISPNWVCYIKDLLYADTLLFSAGQNRRTLAHAPTRTHTQADLFGGGGRGDPVRPRMFWSRGCAEA